MPGAYLEGFFKPELDRVMTSLKDMDDRIRSILTGKKIGKSDPPSDGVAVKDLLKLARTNFNRHEYMAGVADLGRFHKKMFDVGQDVNKFFVDVNRIHNKFLFDGLPEGYDKHLESLKEHMSKKSEASSEYFIKEAGIMDFFYNIGTKRGRSLAAWQKRYPKETKDLREGGEKILDEAQKLLEGAIASLKQMATSRALRKPDQYIEAANKMKSGFDKFDNSFRAYYEKSVVPWLKINEKIKAEEAGAAPSDPAAGLGKGEQSGKVELGHETSVSVPPSASASPPVLPSMGLGYVGVPVNVPTATPAVIAPPGVPSPEQMKPPGENITAKTPPPEGMPTRKPLNAHNRFFASLESMSSEDPLILAAYISKYASTIQGSDPETAINLFDVARKIKG